MRKLQTLPRRDLATIGLLAFFLLIAFTFELYWILNRAQLPELARTNFFARMFEVYAAGDREYFDGTSALPMALEAFNVFVTQIANAWLIHAIIERKSYRHPLQLTLSSYVAYSVVLYFLTMHFDDYAAMGEQTPWGFFIFTAPNLPWLLGYGWMAAESIRAIHDRFRDDQSEPPAHALQQ